MSLADILNSRANELEAPKPIPVGHYIARVGSIGRFSQVGADNKDVVDFDIILLQPGEDVDPDAIRELSAPIAGRKLRGRFFLHDADAAYRFKENFLAKLGLDTSKTLLELCNEANGAQVQVKITQRTYTPPGGEPQIVADIGGYVAI